MLLLFRFVGLFILNFFTINQSVSIDTQQLLEDLRPIIDLSESEVIFTYYLICLTVSLVTLVLIHTFKPFIEIYLLHYFRFSFYILVNLISLSSVYIIFRVYGYSRLYLLIYVFCKSTLQKSFSNHLKECSFIIRYYDLIIIVKCCFLILVE